VLVLRPGGYRPVDLTPEELKQGMRMLYAHGPLPGLPKDGKPRFIPASANAAEMTRAVGLSGALPAHHRQAKRLLGET